MVWRFERMVELVSKPKIVDVVFNKDNTMIDFKTSAGNVMVYHKDNYVSLTDSRLPDKDVFLRTLHGVDCAKCHKVAIDTIVCRKCGYVVCRSCLSPGEQSCPSCHESLVVGEIEVDEETYRLREARGCVAKNLQDNWTRYVTSM